MTKRYTLKFSLAAITLCFLFGFVSGISAKAVKLDGQFFEYATYYISSFDIQTGASDVQLFRYRLYEENNDYPVWLKVWFRASMVSPSLGINTPIPIVELETDPFQIHADLILDNRNLSAATTTLYDLSSPPNPIVISGNLNEVVNPAQFEMLLSAVVTSGRLADGEYTFELRIYSGAESNNLPQTDQDSRSIVVQTPTSINLESPGGALADTSQNELYTTLPVFNWFSQGCTGCENFIRVAEFIRGVHSSVDEAIEDESSLPFNQSQGWEPVGSFTSFQYPLSGAQPLEFGKIYVWQVKQSLMTTSGLEDMFSSIYTFKIVNVGSGPTVPAGLAPVLQVLQQALGDDQFNALFGPGSELQGFIPTGVFTINGITVDESSISYIINQMMNQNLTITNILIED